MRFAPARFSDVQLVSGVGSTDALTRTMLIILNRSV